MGIEVIKLSSSDRVIRALKMVFQRMADIAGDRAMPRSSRPIALAKSACYMFGCLPGRQQIAGDHLVNYNQFCRNPTSVSAKEW